MLDYYEEMIVAVALLDYVKKITDSLINQSRGTLTEEDIRTLKVLKIRTMSIIEKLCPTEWE